MANLGAEFTVNSTAGDAHTPAVATLPDGHYVVTWTGAPNGGGTDIRARLFNADGTPVGNDFAVATSFDGSLIPGTSRVAALPDGHFVVIWHSFDSGDGSLSLIRARVYNGDGTAAGNSFVVDSTATGHQFSPAITALPDGHFVATWHSQDGGDGSGDLVRARLFNGNGTAVGNDFVVDTTTASDQRNPAITALPDGHFVVTWQSSDGGDGSASLLRARLFNADGTPVGSDFIVNSTTAGDQGGAAIAALPDGHFVVAWGSGDGGDGSGNLIRARLFNADGSPAGNDFVVNTSTTGDQGNAAIGALPDGRFMLTWFSYDGGDGDGTVLRGRLFNADATPAGNDFIVNSIATGDQFNSAVTALPDGRVVVVWYSYAGGFRTSAILFDPDGPGVTVSGTPSNDIITGSPVNDQLSGLDGSDTIWAGEGNDVLIGGASADTLNGGLGVDTADYSASSAVIVTLINGLGYGGDAEGDKLSGIENLIGGAGVDSFYGNSAANTFDGGAGADVMGGGAGDDAYMVDSSFEAIIENPGEGTDAVYSTVSYALPANVEFLYLQGSANINGYGNALGNYIVGNSGNNALDGGAGADTMVGGVGDDAYFVDDSFDVITENSGEGFDAVYASMTYQLGADIEHLYLQGSAVAGYGNALANYIQGNSGDNGLDGMGGVDVLAGGLGDDAYYLDSSFEVVIENSGEGTDAVYATESYALPANVEFLYLQGSANINGYGNSLGNFLVGNSGNNALDGGAGADTMQGGDGSDAYFVDDSFDVINENAGEGGDAVYASQTYVLGANVEHLYLLGSAADGYGNGLDNFILGTSGDNLINGLGSEDALEGNGGNDSFVFSAGEANNDEVVDFNGNGAAAGDALVFSGFGSAAQGATFIQIGATNQWTIHSGLDLHDEVITFRNSAAIDASDYSFI